MGLAGPKKKTKISHDPNNTRWTRDSASFGHKIMSSQGWNPGELLGAKDAPHAEFHTAANASYIRVALREDNLGLGAKIGSGVGHGECTGLDVFKNLLGRLNGADEAELAKEQQSRDDLKRAIYTERKWGSIRFVPGGVLVGDKIQDLIDGEKERLRKLADDESGNSSSDLSSESETEEEEVSEPVEQAPKKSKKRKAESLEDSAPEASAAKVKNSKKTQDADVDSEDDKKLKKKSKKRRDKEADADESSDEAKAKKSKKEKKEKKKEKKEKRSKKEKSNEDSVDESNSKEAKKAAKREKREKRKALEEAGSSTEITVVASTPVSAASTGRSTPVMMQGRHAVRSRNIAAKRLAAMDTASLNQIFMIKS
ncbi:hypothetical protein BP6252_05112 [Coleophoma cylindrospora]|uniref:G-patch domain-containing protein n=1 Tax=Coleophoma cylindrospora TaxID=1849047 RepID=A0A3D8RSP1_9HELO|nr:hypothetical protein BP6252_05112 [Coleophoma cylindrospora]